MSRLQWQCIYSSSLGLKTYFAPTPPVVYIVPAIYNCGLKNLDAYLSIILIQSVCVCGYFLTSSSSSSSSSPSPPCARSVADIGDHGLNILSVVSSHDELIVGRFFSRYEVFQTVCVFCALSFSTFGTTNLSTQFFSFIVHQLCSHDLKIVAFFF